MSTHEHRTDFHLATLDPAGHGAAASNGEAPRGSGIAPHVTGMLRALGEDPSRDGLVRTPERVERAMRFLTSGYDTDVRTIVNGALFEEEYREMVVVKDIEVFSLCEHHLLPFFGRAHVAYLPNGRILGLSKVARVVEMFARRLQVQERMTRQVAEALDEVLAPRGVAVVIEARHLCMVMRGVEKTGSTAMTRVALGAFADQPAMWQQGRTGAAGLAVAVQHGGDTFDAETATRRTTVTGGDDTETQHVLGSSSIDAAWAALGIPVAPRIALGVSVGAARFRNTLHVDTDTREHDASGAPLGSVSRLSRTRDVVLESTVAPRLHYAVRAEPWPGVTAGIAYRAPVTADWKRARFDTTRVAEVFFPPTQLFRASTAAGADSLAGVPMHLQPSVQYVVAAARPGWPLQGRLRLTRARTVRLQMLAARPLFNAPMTVEELPARWWTLVDGEAEGSVTRGVRVLAGWRQALRAAWSTDGTAVDDVRCAGPRFALAMERWHWRVRASLEWLQAPANSREPVRAAPATVARRVDERTIGLTLERF